jgi:DNA repair protein RecN (Recombination protein N)
MLTRLFIQNIAVIAEASITPGPWLNVLTGETGAGKTVLISSIEAVLGERTPRDIIRTGEEKATVSAMFEDISPHAAKALGAMGFEDDDGAVLISREMTTAGKNTCRINGMPATLSMLREIAPLLIHIHGQRDAMQLLESRLHLDMVDGFAEIEREAGSYAEAYHKLKKLESERDSLTMDESQKAQRIDMLRYQIAEIEAADLEDGNEKEELLARRRMIQGSERIREGLAQAHAALRGNGDAPGITDLMRELDGGVSQAAQYVESFGDIKNRIGEIGFELEDFAADVRMALDEFEFDPREIDRVELRLDTINKLERKYGGSIAEILAHYRSASDELLRICSNEKHLEAVTAQAEEARKEATLLAAALTKRRLAAAEELIRLVEDELCFLDMPAVKLSIEHKRCALGETGADEIEFFIVTNVGDTPKPLSRTASGGELARIMLAIKNVLAGRDNVATLIFDEVDTGVSGRAAGKIGRKLREVSKARQVICVTHLAQVAAFADSHFLIAKRVEAGKTLTGVTRLSPDEAIHELARITSGDMATPASLQSAREMREQAHM